MSRAAPRRWTDEDYALLRRLWPQEGMTSQEIADRLGRKRGPVERVAREVLGLLPRVTIFVRERRKRRGE